MKPSFDVSEIDFVLLTHGHLDHVGYLPSLVKQGFKNNIYGTTPTIEIAKLILLDSAKIQEEDANRANVFKYSKHKPAKPLYSSKEAEAVFPLFNSIPVNKWIDVDPNISFRFQYNGHILGACFIELKLNGKLIIFSGDIGRPEDPLLREPAKPELADAIILEATYGNRLHPPNAKHLLANEINTAVQRLISIVICYTTLIAFILTCTSFKQVVDFIPNLDMMLFVLIINIPLKGCINHLQYKYYSSRNGEISSYESEKNSISFLLEQKPKRVLADYWIAKGYQIYTGYGVKYPFKNYTEVDTIYDDTYLLLNKTMQLELRKNINETRIFTSAKNSIPDFVLAPQDYGFSLIKENDTNLLYYKK